MVLFDWRPVDRLRLTLFYFRENAQEVPFSARTCESGPARALWDLRGLWPLLEVLEQLLHNIAVSVFSA